MPQSSSLSELVFASFLNYSPRGRSELSQGSKSFALKLKANRVVLAASQTTAAQYLASRVLQEIRGTALDGFFRPGDCLVPVPTSSVSKPGTVWPALEIAEALVSVGLGSAVTVLLNRETPMRKSALAGSGSRPTLDEHLESLSISGGLDVGERLILVDDLVTKGTTLLACARTVHTALIDREVQAFAAFRTLGLQPEIERVVEPCLGRIWLQDGAIHREP